MKPLTLKSHAKLNWFLYVGDTRPDGYHEIDTLFQELEIHDTLTFEKRNDNELKLSGFPDDIPHEMNLVTKAWRAAKENGSAFGINGFNITINKILPQGGGLGGGSSNAAAMLNAISQFYPDYPLEVLDTIGRSIGSDVAFFLNGGIAHASGRGEILQQLPNSRIEIPLVLYFPDEKMNTKEAYKALDLYIEREKRQMTTDAFIDKLKSYKTSKINNTHKNDFELVAKNFSWYNQAQNLLIRNGCIDSLLCGSGSTLAGIAKSTEDAKDIARQIGERAVYTTTKCSINLRR